MLRLPPRTPAPPGPAPIRLGGGVGGKTGANAPTALVGTAAARPHACSNAHSSRTALQLPSRGSTECAGFYIYI